MIAAASYASLFGILLWQALRGQPLIGPDGTMLMTMGVWMVASAAAAALALRGGAPVQSTAVVY
jgi:hypothetical protein